MDPHQISHLKLELQLEKQIRFDLQNQLQFILNHLKLGQHIDLDDQLRIYSEITSKKAHFATQQADQHQPLFTEPQTISHLNLPSNLSKTYRRKESEEFLRLHVFDKVPQIAEVPIQSIASTDQTSHILQTAPSIIDKRSEINASDSTNNGLVSLPIEKSTLLENPTVSSISMLLDSPGPSSIVVQNEQQEQEEGEEEMDIDTYTLGLRGQIIDFFTKSAEKLNLKIDQQDSLQAQLDSLSGSEKDQPRKAQLRSQIAEIESSIELQVLQNKQYFESQIRPLIQEYLVLIQEQVQSLQIEEDELLKFCSTMYPSTCE